MPWDVEQLNEGTKFPWKGQDLDKPNCEWIELLLLPDEENLKLFKQLGIKEKKLREINPKTRRVEYVRDWEISEEQRQAYDEEVWDRTIVNWNLLKPDGTAVECTREMKTKFMRQSPKFKKWYQESMEMLEDDIRVYKETNEKNS